MGWALVRAEAICGERIAVKVNGERVGATLSSVAWSVGAGTDGSKGSGWELGASPLLLGGFSFWCLLGVIGVLHFFEEAATMVVSLAGGADFGARGEDAEFGVGGDLFYGFGFAAVAFGFEVWGG